MIVIVSVPIPIESLISNPNVSVTFILVERPVIEEFWRLVVNPVIFWFTNIVFEPSNCDKETVDIPEITTLSPFNNKWG